MLKYFLYRFALILFLGSTFQLRAQTPAFPGAEGYGKWASGGRGGEVLAVTNLLDDPNNPPEGSFRWAIEKLSDRKQPLTIVFRVSGIIELKGKMNVQRSNLTIAGQTAPGDGICFKGHYFRLSGGGSAGIQKNIILRYLRFRPGLDINESDLAKGIGAIGVENCEHVIVDHCSFSWANEECAIFYDNKYTTVQWCIASEGLYNALHAKGERSYCGVWGGQYASYHHNLIAHNRSRTVRFNGARAHDTLALVDYRNNVVYNWNVTTGCYGGEVEINGGASYTNMVNNYYKPGPATSKILRFASPSHNSGNPVVGKWHLSGNLMEGDSSINADNSKGISLAKIPPGMREMALSSFPFSIESPLPEHPADSAYLNVLDRVGAAYPRDPVDLRIIEETRTGTASGTGDIGKGIIDDPASVGGYPSYLTYNVPSDMDLDGMDDDWEILMGLDSENREDRNIIGDKGYTMLELYLNSLVEHISILAEEPLHIKGIEPFYCEGLSSSLISGHPSGGTFIPGPGLDIFGGDSALFNPVGSGDFTLQYTLTRTNGPSDTVQKTIKVYPFPKPDILGLDSSYLQQTGTVTLTGTPEGGSFLDTEGITRPGRDESPFDLSVPGDYEVYYNYVLAPACGDTAVGRTTIIATTDIREENADLVRIYPNPVQSHFRIMANAPIDGVGIYTLSGIMIKKCEIEKGDMVNIEPLPPGLYIIGIHLNSGHVFRRITKMIY